MRQYFKPPDDDAFAGDAMPFCHDGVFHVLYLLDHGHHADLGGLGGHQWAHDSSTDLIHWQHHPLALAITEPWEGSICTGSVFYNQGIFYAFYPTRMRDRTERLGVATSRDAIHFTKHLPSPFALPGPEYSPYHYRDPFVFRDPDTGLFHMLITSMVASPEAGQPGGCLAQLVSPDLQTWKTREPFLISEIPGAPECSDLFTWNGWSYLIFSHGLVAHYLMARSPLGPWIRPETDTFDGPMASVMKTAPFGPDRRIGVAWVGARKGDRDDGERQWGGNLVFRELVQRADGTLGTRFPPELQPPTGSPLPFPEALSVPADHHDRTGTDLPRDVRITCRLLPAAGARAFGISLEGSEASLRFLPGERTVSLGNASIHDVAGLDGPLSIDLVACGDIVDLYIDGDRCLINRLPERGSGVSFFSEGGATEFVDICARPLL